MSEAEEFEFRRRYEMEKGSKPIQGPPTPTYGPQEDEEGFQKATTATRDLGSATTLDRQNILSAQTGSPRQWTPEQVDQGRKDELKSLAGAPLGLLSRTLPAGAMMIEPITGEIVPVGESVAGPALSRAAEGAKGMLTGPTAKGLLKRAAYGAATGLGIRGGMY